MRLYKSYIIPVFILFSALLNGCIDDPVNYTGSMVNGSVYDKYGMNNPYIKVSVGDYPIVATDVYGQFSLENNQYPYNITVSNLSYSTNKYMGMTILNPQLLSYDDYGYSNPCYIVVHFPELETLDDEAFVKFVSIDNNTQSDDLAFYGDKLGFRVGMINDKNTIEGKLIFLQFKRSDIIYSYEKFGMMDVVLHSGSQEFFFDTAQINYNPDEIYSYFHVNLSNEFTSCNTRIDLTFPGMCENSNISYLEDFSNMPSGYIVLPDLPMLPYNIKVENTAGIWNGIFNQIFSKVWEYGKPGEYINLNQVKSLYLNLPEDGEKNINDNTKFVFNDIDPGGIYIYKISNEITLDSRTVNIITDKYPLTFKDFKTWGYQFTPNTKYYWGVVKYPGYRNIDEFVSSKLKEDTVYKKIPASEWFSFTTQ